VDRHQFPGIEPLVEAQGAAAAVPIETLTAQVVALSNLVMVIAEGAAEIPTPRAVVDDRDP
jgi:hypothetical protein